ncbi:MAG: Peptidase S51 dipeptidase E [Parcubacteria group bacterium GW2011_GWC2_39_14]|nr:MAG: Peptidase S51 dipeptidase E [Parcubacteria group bacterium GW2011_GWC2_39_14]KKR55430.1 MAG: Peptidase S51 dipeptidase E [Parcubacteria group bacterium GW2011_GWA2_40_23]
MTKLILSSQGFQKNKTLKKKLLALLPKVAKNLSIAIITTASAEWKERNKHAILAQQVLSDMNFKQVKFVDIEFENPNILKKFDVIYINGGNPFYLLYHLKKSGSDRVITQLANQGVIIVGISGGGVVLGPNINIVDYFDKKINIVKLKDLTGLNLTDTFIYPHYTNEVEDKIKKFENKYQCKVGRLNDNQSVIIEK